MHLLLVLARSRQQAQQTLGWPVTFTLRLTVSRLDESRRALAQWKLVPPSQLADWHRLAERRATLRHALGRDVTAEDLALDPLAATTLQLTTPGFVDEISETLELSAIQIV